MSSRFSVLYTCPPKEYSVPHVTSNNSIEMNKDIMNTIRCNFDNLESNNKVGAEEMLVKATSVGDFDAVQSLVNSGVPVDVSDYNKSLYYASLNYMTPLQIAASRGYVKCLQLLIDKGADVNAKDRFDVTALHVAAEQGHYLCLKMLLDAGADCNAITKYTKKLYYKSVSYAGGTTPLHLAAGNNHISCVKELINYGADYNAVDENGRTGLYVAAQAGYDDCVVAQLKNAVGRDILSLPGFDTGDTPLHFAVRRGMIDSVRELLSLGSDVNHQNYGGNSPLHTCVISDYCEPDVYMKILELLVLNGYNTDVNLPDSFDLTPLHYVCFNAGTVLNRRPEMAKFLIAYGANVNIINHQGHSLIKYEYNSADKDITILKAVVESLNVAPPPRMLEDLNFAASIEHMPNNMIVFYTMWLALKRGMSAVNDFVNLQQNKNAEKVIHQHTLLKQNWYEDVYVNPPSLLHTCRCSIREVLGYKRLRYIKNLPLPRSLKSYLLLGCDVNL